jgi:cobyrinic acid a,c-diamide synthase
LLRRAGAELVFFSPLTDLLPDDVSGLYFGGGCPERYAEELASNRQLLASVYAFADAGGVVYAEYAGLIYLSQSVQPINSLPCTMGLHPLPLLCCCWHHYGYG